MILNFEVMYENRKVSTSASTEGTGVLWTKKSQRVLAPL